MCSHLAKLCAGDKANWWQAHLIWSLCNTTEVQSGEVYWILKCFPRDDKQTVAPGSIRSNQTSFIWFIKLSPLCQLNKWSWYVLLKLRTANDEKITDLPNAKGLVMMWTALSEHTNDSHIPQSTAFFMTFSTCCFWKRNNVGMGLISYHQALPTSFICV